LAEDIIITEALIEEFQSHPVWRRLKERFKEKKEEYEGKLRKCPVEEVPETRMRIDVVEEVLGFTGELFGDILDDQKTQF